MKINKKIINFIVFPIMFVAIIFCLCPYWDLVFGDGIISNITMMLNALACGYTANKIIETLYNKFIKI